MGGVKSCHKHGVFASKRCAVCHAPLCVQCKIKDGCCSDKCFKSRQKFAFKNMKGVQGRNEGLNIMGLIKLAALGAALYFAAKHFGYL